MGEHSIREIFGKNLKYYRKKKCFSQEKLSEKVAITPKHLSAIETGASFVSAELLENLVQALNVSAAALFYNPEEKSADDSILTLVDTVVEEELHSAARNIKSRLRLREKENFP